LFENDLRRRKSAIIITAAMEMPLCQLALRPFPVVLFSVSNPVENKKEVKTAWFSPPGVGGVLQNKTFSGSAAFPAREVCVLTRVML
jgi:hypothetical protein